MSTSRKLVVISAGLGVPSSTRLLADRLASAVSREFASLSAEGQAVEERAAGERAAGERVAGERVAGNQSVSVEVIELRELAREITNNLLTGFPNQALRSALEKVARADGLIAVTPVFTASYSGLFKSFIDVLEPDSLVGKPILIAATGGTERHSLVLEHAMRPLFAYLRAVVVPTAIYAAASDWGTKAAAQDLPADPERPSADRLERPLADPTERPSVERLERPLAERIEQAAGELARLIESTPSKAPDDPYDNPTPFEQLFTR